MQIDQLQQLSEWLAATDIDRLELQGPGEHLCLQRNGSRVELVPHEPVQDESVPRTVAAATSVGVFLHGHPLREGPLAPPGTQVRAGQVVGLLRIGALLLPVTAPEGGLVADALAQDGAVVGYGTPLVEIQSAGGQA